MWRDVEEGLTHDDKRRDVEEGIGGQIMEVQPIVEHESANEWVERESQPTDEMRDENDPLIGLRSGDDLSLSRNHWAICLDKYPASRSWVMSFSLMVEDIHLPCAPDMVGVLSWGRKDENLGAGAREWVDGRR